MSETLFPTPVEGDDDNYLSSDSMIPRKLRRATAKEELVALCGDFIDAVLLNQMIKYQAQSRDREAYIEEERQRMASRGQILNLPRAHGFFYKDATELSKESMVGLHKSNIGKRLRRFEERGWMEHRRNPSDPFDYVYQYRVDVVEIDRRLKEMGFPGLDGWLMTRINNDLLPPETSPLPRSSDSQLRGSESQPRGSAPQPRNSENDIPSKENKKQQQETTKQELTTSTGTASVFKNSVVVAPWAPFSELDSSDSTTPAAPQSVGEVLDASVEEDDEFTPEKVKWRQLFNDIIATGEVSPTTATQMLERFGVDACDVWVDIPGKLEEMARQLPGTVASIPTEPVTYLPDAAAAHVMVEKLVDAGVKPEELARQWVAKYGAARIAKQLVWVIDSKPRDVARYLRKSIQATFGPMFENGGVSIEELEKDELLRVTQGKAPGGGLDAEAERLDATWSKLDATTRERLEGQIDRKLGVMGATSRSDEARVRLRRQYMQDLRAGKQILEETPAVPPVVRKTANG